MKPATVQKRAGELLHHGVITGCIRELQAAHRQRHDVTMDRLVDELEEARSFSMVVGQTGAAVTATMGKAKLHGLITNHHPHTGEIKMIREMSNEDLEAEIDEREGKRCGTRGKRKQAGA